MCELGEREVQPLREAAPKEAGHGRDLPVVLEDVRLRAKQHVSRNDVDRFTVPFGQLARRTQLLVCRGMQVGGCGLGHVVAKGT